MVRGHILIEVGDILEYIEQYRQIPLGQPDYDDYAKYWLVIEINDSGSCTLFSLEKNYKIQEFLAFINDPEVYKKL